MLIKSLSGLLAAAAIGLLGGCATPCDAPGGLCAPIGANTSAPEQVQPRAVPAPQAATAAPELPAVPAKPVTRIALMLPLRSEALARPAGALRAGFMAAWERDRAGFEVNLIETGDTSQDTLEAYRTALRENDIVVGPLARSAVTAVAASALVDKPTIALNHPEPRAGAVLPQRMLVIGLSIEEEARQVADWAAAENPGGSALIVSGANAWQRRLAGAFAARFRQLGQQTQLAEIPDSNGYLSESALHQLRERIEIEQPALLFAALDADQARQLRRAIGDSLPLYGASSVNPGLELAMPELDGMRLLDLPWQIEPEHSAVMVYPRLNPGRGMLDLDRLYALGIDAFRVAREITLQPGRPFQLDGVTGRLSVRFGDGPARFERTEPTAVYLGGAFMPVAQP